MSEPGPGSPPQAADVLHDAGRRFLARLIFVSIFLALLGLLITAIHFIWPTPLMFTLFMTVGQGSFFAAMILYIIVILADLRGRGVL